MSMLDKIHDDLFANYLYWLGGVFFSIGLFFYVFATVPAGLEVQLPFGIIFLIMICGVLGLLIIVLTLLLDELKPKSDDNFTPITRSLLIILLLMIPLSFTTFAIVVRDIVVL